MSAQDRKVKKPKAKKPKLAAPVSSESPNVKVAKVPKEKKRRRPKASASMPEEAVKDEPHEKSVPLPPPKKSKKKKNKLVEEVKEEEEGREVEHTDFASFGLDDRLLKAIAQQGWSRPTLVQDRFIPLALEGKDILARARTGSGKTAAFAIPLIQRVLEKKEETGKSGIRGLVLTPSKELARQVHGHVAALAAPLSRIIRTLDLTAYSDPNTQKAMLGEEPDIVVGTPSRVLKQLESGALSAIRDSLLCLVVDEADLIFSYGFAAEARDIVKYLPPVYQAFLTSATLSEEVGELKKLFLHNPVTMKLEEAHLPSSNQLTQYHVKCSEEDKWVVFLSLLKLSLIRGKSLVFVRDIDRCYRLKLFLQQFGLKAAVLNSCLPANARCHIVEQFNEGVYPLVIAADDASLAQTTSAPEEEQPAPAEEKKKPELKKRKHKSDRESGVARGIDFQQVANVINFDFPSSLHSYIHRVGRTARGWNQGTALSFASEEEEPFLDQVILAQTETGGEDALKPYQLRMEELDGFRYRARDVLKSVTSSAIREARLEEIKREILSSKRLKSFFAANPRDLSLLRHDASTHGLRHQEHLRSVPEYLVPDTLKGSVSLPSRRRKRYVNKTWLPAQKRRAKDPLSSFQIDD